MSIVENAIFGTSIYQRKPAYRELPAHYPDGDELYVVLVVPRGHLSRPQDGRGLLLWRVKLLHEEVPSVRLLSCIIDGPLHIVLHGYQPAFVENSDLSVMLSYQFVLHLHKGLKVPVAGQANRKYLACGIKTLKVGRRPKPRFTSLLLLLEGDCLRT